MSDSDEKEIVACTHCETNTMKYRIAYEVLSKSVSH